MKNKPLTKAYLNKAGFKNQKELYKLIEKTQTTMSLWMKEPPKLLTLYLDSKIKYKELEAKFEALEMIYKSS